MRGECSSEMIVGKGAESRGGGGKRGPMESDGKRCKEVDG